MKSNAFSKTYDARTVLDMPETEFPEGQVSAIIGPNGSGKSTSARILAGIERSDDKADVITGITVGYLPQKSFSFRMSTKKNILLNGKKTRRTDELMNALGIDSIADQSAKKLSGGESAKMALCRLLAGSYDLLILDEPTSAMDMESTLKAETLIRDYCKSTGCTIILITHSIQQARRIADRALFLHNGILKEYGPAKKVLFEPDNEETRRFLDFYGA